MRACTPNHVKQLPGPFPGPARPAGQFPALTEGLQVKPQTPIAAIQCNQEQFEEVREWLRRPAALTLGRLVEHY